MSASLAIASASRLEGIADHVVNVGRLASTIAVRLGLGRARAELLRATATLHDIGKVAIPDRVLLKPGPLSESERRIMEQHTVIGHDLLAGSGNRVLDLAATIALDHHERWDGNGYPRQLAGERISLEARIVAVADVFDSLTRDRPYRPAFDDAIALGRIQLDRGLHFDPDVVDAFLSAR